MELAFLCPITHPSPATTPRRPRIVEGIIGRAKPAEGQAWRGARVSSRKGVAVLGVGQVLDCGVALPRTVVPHCPPARALV